MEIATILVVLVKSNEIIQTLLKCCSLVHCINRNDQKFDWPIMYTDILYPICKTHNIARDAFPDHL